MKWQTSCYLFVIFSHLYSFLFQSSSSLLLLPPVIICFYSVSSICCHFFLLTNPDERDTVHKMMLMMMMYDLHQKSHVFHSLKHDYLLLIQFIMLFAPISCAMVPRLYCTHIHRKRLVEFIPVYVRFMVLNNLWSERINIRYILN